jgi:spermidine synthase
MMKSFSRLIMLGLLGTLLVPLITSNFSILMIGAPSPEYRVRLALMVFLALLVTAGCALQMKKLDALFEAGARQQKEFLDSIPLRHIDWAIAGAAALSLFLELAVIRWQGTVFEFFAFYKNFSLLCCFAGLGLGYALADRRGIPLAFTIPLLGWQFGLLIGLRHGMKPEELESLRILPFREQLNMGIASAHNLTQSVAIYFFLSVVFLLTVLVFIPVGQLCGRLMQRREKLRAYGLNLLGSLAGVLLMLTLSWLWTPPLVWFAVCFLGILLFHVRKPVPLILAMSFALASLVVLAWPVEPLWNKIYSPYQLLEMSHGERGLVTVRAAGHYYQRVHDLSRANRNVETDPELQHTRNYYEMPYRVYGHPQQVAVVGAGTGNDVAAALRSGATHVDAIEIDPAILMIGKQDHPEHPYSSPRVTAVVTDARSFLRTTANSYDMIVYGLLDSHTLLSQASSVRLDSFVYTVEGLRDARRHLNPGGMISISFSIINDELGRKFYLMMRQAFDGRPPVCIRGEYDGSVIFLEARDADVAPPTNLLAETGFADRTAFYAQSPLQADVSTDDWPFLYMPRRIYPVSYLAMVVLIALLSFLVTANFFSERPRFSHTPFFLLGAGFMLVETKGITELGLTFGNSWQVIGVIIAGILVMAFLGNCVVQWLRIQQPFFPYLLLLASLGLGWYVSRNGGLASTSMGRLETAALLTCPIFFSGIVFSTLLGSRGEISGIMAVNLVGAILGGLLEYNSMYLGFRALYLMAMVLYALALVWDLPLWKPRKVAALHASVTSTLSS